MLAFFENGDYINRRFPGLLIETNLMEEFLEHKAQKGEIFVGFSKFALSGYFKKNMPKNYHYCIDVYYRPLKENELDTEEFNEYKETCLACGWSYVCAFENIVVFYSEEEGRPRELQTDPELQRSILKQITLKAERRQMFIRIVSSLFLIALYSLNVELMWFKVSGEDRHWWDMSFVNPWAFLIVKEIWEVIIHIRIMLIVQKEKPLPRLGVLWNSFGLTEIFLSGWAIVAAFACFWFQLYFRGMCAVIAFILVAGELVHSLRASKKQKMDYRLWLEEEWGGAYKIVGGIIVFLCLFTALIALPTSDKYYRFSLECAVGKYEMAYHDNQEEDAVYDSALSQKDVAFLEQADGIRQKENPGHYTEFEKIYYIQDAYTAGINHSYEDYFYVGTLISRLLDAEKLDDYLKEKHLTLEGAEQYNLVQGVDSYFLPSGKEIVHVSGNMVVIHFLDKRDERMFTLKEPEVRAAVTEKTEKILEMYRR